MCVGHFAMIIIADGFKQTKLSKIFINTLYATNSFLTLFKAVILYKKSNQIEIFLLKMDKIPFFPAPDERATKDLITKRIERLRKLLCMLFASVVVVILTEPLITLKITEARPISIWYPFEWKGKLNLCLILYLYEGALAICFATTLVSIDTFLGSVLQIIGGQLESLGYRLRSLPTDNGNVANRIKKMC